MRVVGVWGILLTWMALSTASLRLSRPLRWKYEFKPLIGGPKLLKLHVSTRISFDGSNGTSDLVLDFVPAGENITREMTSGLLGGESIKGLIRMKIEDPSVRREDYDYDPGHHGGSFDGDAGLDCASDPKSDDELKVELQSLGNRLITETVQRWKGVEYEYTDTNEKGRNLNLNIYTSNCYHFTFFLSSVLIEESRRRA